MMLEPRPQWLIRSELYCYILVFRFRTCRGILKVLSLLCIVCKSNFGPSTLMQYISLQVYLLPVGTSFCCSSKPTGGAGGSFGQENTFKSGHINHKGMTVPSDWMCIICGCVNFARRTSCFQVHQLLFFLFVGYPEIFYDEEVEYSGWTSMRVHMIVKLKKS